MPDSGNLMTWTTDTDACCDMTETILDVRGLPSPEPLERVLTALSDADARRSPRLLIDVEPRPLYSMLDRNDLCHHTEPGTVSGYAVTIWPRDGATEGA